MLPAVARCSIKFSATSFSCTRSLKGASASLRYPLNRRLVTTDKQAVGRIPSEQRRTEQPSGQQQIVKPYVEGDDTHFGFSQVSVESKEERVRHVFEAVADSYDVMNDLMSGGLHRLWKDHLVHVSSVEAIASAERRLALQNAASTTLKNNERSFKILDVAGGTGDVAFRFVDAARCYERSKSSGVDPIQITVFDINSEMLRVGERRAIDRYGRGILDASKGLSFVQGNAQSLDQLTDNSFDMYTIAFGLRNVTDVDKALREAHRVLKPGGRFLCLEFSQVPDPLFHSIYDSYSFNVIPAIGGLIAGDRSSYQYLVESIRKFPNQDELMTRLQGAGFSNCKYTNMTGGIVAIHEGWKNLEISR